MNCKFFKRLFLFGFQTGIRTTNQKYCQKWQESQQKSHLNYKVNLFNAATDHQSFQSRRYPIVFQNGQRLRDEYYKAVSLNSRFSIIWSCMIYTYK